MTAASSEQRRYLCMSISCRSGCVQLPDTRMQQAGQQPGWRWPFGPAVVAGRPIRHVEISTAHALRCCAASRTQLAAKTPPASALSGDGTCRRARPAVGCGAVPIACRSRAARWSTRSPHSARPTTRQPRSAASVIPARTGGRQSLHILATHSASISATRASALAHAQPCGLGLVNVHPDVAHALPAVRRGPPERNRLIHTSRHSPPHFHGRDRDPQSIHAVSAASNQSGS